MEKLENQINALKDYIEELHQMKSKADSFYLYDKLNWNLEEAEKQYKALTGIVQYFIDNPYLNELVELKKKNN